MSWRTDSTGKIFSSYPYRIETVRNRFKLYKYVQLPDRSWSMKLLGKYEELDDAKAAAASDKEQQSLWGTR